MTLVVFADVTTPECLIASQFVDRLLERGVEVTWKAVQASGRHLVTTRPLPADDAVAQSEHVRELAAAFKVALPDLWNHPTVLPSNTPATAALAEADSSGVLRSVRQRLFRAYWMDRLDIGSPETLRTLLSLHFLRGIQRPSPLGDFGYAVSIGGGPVSSLGWHRMREWQQQWADAGEPAVPAVVRADGSVASGQDALRVLAEALPPVAATGQGTGDAVDAAAGGTGATTGSSAQRTPGRALAVTADPTVLAHERWLRGLQRRSWRWADPSVQFWWLRPDP